MCDKLKDSLENPLQPDEARVESRHERDDVRTRFVIHEIRNAVACMSVGLQSLESQIASGKISISDDTKIDMDLLRQGMDRLMEISNLKTEDIDKKTKPFDEKGRGEVSEGKPAESDEAMKSNMVFVIDDDVMVGKTLERMIKKECSNGKSPVVRYFQFAKKAKEAIESGVVPGYIFCDIMMPEMNGRDFYEWLKENHPELTGSISFVTGGTFTSSTNEFYREMSKQGRLIRKPFTFEEIQERVKKALNLG